MKTKQQAFFDEPLYYLELLYFRYGLQFRLKDRTSSYFVICIPKKNKSTETENTVQMQAPKKTKQTKLNKKINSSKSKIKNIKSKKKMKNVNLKSQS